MRSELTSRERITRIFKNQQYDRPALKLWGLKPGEKMLHPAYTPVYEKGMQVADIFSESRPEFNMLYGSLNNGQFDCVTYPPYSPEFGQRVSTLHTPEGDLRSVYTFSTINQPGYITECFVKEPDDLKKILSLKYEEIPFDIGHYLLDDRAVGDRGIALYCMGEPLWTLQELCGSELLALMSTDENSRELIKEVLDIFARRIKKLVQHVFEAGIKPVFSWCGPELCIPPLMSYDDFEDFVLKVDKPLCDYIHENGGYTWVHSHGKMRNMIERFIRMGVDVLNPIEPPPMGDITLEEAADIFKNRIGLEGNVELGELMISEPEELRIRIKEAVDGGTKSGRFILCQSAGYMENVLPSERFISNMLMYLEYGYELVTSYA